MRATGRVCDVCEKFALDADKTPAEWFIVHRAIGDGTVSESQEVCSAQCLCKLGSQVKTLEATAPTDPKETVPCPLCDKPCKGTQGLNMHLTRSHPEGT